MIKIKNLLVGAAVVALPLTLAPLSASAAEQVDPIAQSGHCTDGGGVLYEASLNWNYIYKDRAGNTRASVSDLEFGTKEDTDGAGIDWRRRVYSGRATGATVKIQDLVADGDERNPITGNPKNPLSFPNLSKVTLVVGTDGDGLGNCKITFLQPELGTKPAAS